MKKSQIKEDRTLREIIYLLTIAFVSVHAWEVYNSILLGKEFNFDIKSIFLFIGILLYIDFERRLTYLYLASFVAFLYLFPLSYIYLIPYLFCEYLVYLFCITEIRVLKHPKTIKIITIHVAFIILLYTTFDNEVALSHSVPKLLLFLFLYIKPSIWRYSYLIKDSHAGTKKYSFSNFLFFKIAVWGGSSTPFGKGLSFLEKIEVKNKEQLYLSIKAGVSLIFLYSLYNFIRVTLIKIDLLSYAPGNQVSIVWVGILNSFVLVHLKWFGVFHLTIGLLRVFGFNAPPATNKAFLSETFVNFWNRYYYYYKELMVEFFFYPTFFLFFKKNLKLRTAFATFMAAGVGNFYYHLLSRNLYINTDKDATTFMIYCILLASIVSISQYRFLNGKHRPNKKLLVKLRNISLVVATFFFLWSYARYGWEPFGIILNGML